MSFFKLARLDRTSKLTLREFSKAASLPPTPPNEPPDEAHNSSARLARKIVSAMKSAASKSHNDAR